MWMLVHVYNVDAYQLNLRTYHMVILKMNIFQILIEGERGVEDNVQSQAPVVSSVLSATQG